MLDMILSHILNYQHETYLQFDFSTVTSMNKFFNISGKKKTIGKKYWLAWNIIISSWSSYKRMWTKSSKDNSFSKLVNQLPYVLLTEKGELISVVNAPKIIYIYS